MNVNLRTTHVSEHSRRQLARSGSGHLSEPGVDVHAVLILAFEELLSVPRLDMRRSKTSVNRVVVEDGVDAAEVVRGREEEVLLLR